MRERTWVLLLGLLTALSMARVAATHPVFSQIFDEAAHLAGGYEIVTHGAFAYDMYHPPLARVLFALPFTGVEVPPTNNPVVLGNELLTQNDAYVANLTLARFGNLLFLALGIVSVALWGRHLFTPIVGLLAALLYASLPPILAHAGFATTDMAATATLTLAFYALTLFLEESSWRRTIFLGIAVALGLLAKFSFIPYFGVGALVLVIVRRRFPIGRIAAAIAIAFVVFWAGYGFTIGTLADADQQAAAMSQEVFGSPRLATIPLPAPAYITGILILKHHDALGHEAFLLGEVRTQGWWYYFPVALFFKTPIPFLVLALAGIALAARQRPELPLIAAAILAVAMTSHINIGVRHVAPLYAPLAICGALAITAWPRLRAGTIALVLWLVVGSIAAHPDYLPWFNGFARHPETILSDSNLDWGQDVLRLAEAARRLHIQRMTISLFTTTPRDRVGLPPLEPMRVMQPIHGWFAISETSIVFGRGRTPELRAWLDGLIAGKPYIRVGKSIRLYNLGSGPR